MNESSAKINADERVYHVSRAFASRRYRLILAGAAVLVFFSLPLFLKARTAGIALWSSLIVLLVFFALQRIRGANYVITATAIVKYTDDGARALWRVPLSEVADVKRNRSSVIIALTHRSLFLYNISEPEAFIRVLRERIYAVNA